MKKTSESIIQEILFKKASLTGVQQTQVMNMLSTDSGFSYQELAHFLAPQIGATVLDIYSFLMTRDKDNRRDNDYNKHK